MAGALVTAIKRFIGTAAEIAALDLTNIPVGSTFLETDGKLKILDTAGNLVDKPAELVQLAGSNVQLLAPATTTWDGTDTVNYVEVPVASGDVLVRVDNNADQEITVTFEHEVADGVFVSYDPDNTTFTVAASTGDKIFPPIQKWPKFLGGRIVLTAGAAPTAAGTTVVEVQEV